ncbi:MAG: guanylate kinase [Arachnia sp.]
MARGRVWIISGPSGVGKGTVCRELQRSYSAPFYSVSMTTREPRPTEVDGVSYHFVSPETFAGLVSAGQFLEFAQVHGSHCYGTPSAPVIEALAHDRPVILEIDLAGARQVKANVPEAHLVFLAPPSWEELENRLRGRGTEDEATIQRRLATARQELAARHEADHVIVNRSIGETVAALVALMGL